MFKNYLKIAIRNILRHKVYSFINIFGLAVGMACCILILLLVQHHLSYDRFHKNVGDIYRVIKEVKFTNYSDKWAVTTGPLGPSLKKDFPDIINAARIYYPLEYLLTYKDKNFYEKPVFADGSLFEMFSFPFIKGNPSTALSEPYSIVISEKMAEKYFGIENPLGKIITVSQKYSFQVTGVMKNIPRNSSLKADFFIPVKSAKDLMGRRDDQWATGSWVKTFVQLQKRRPYQEVVQKISNYLYDKPTIEKDARLNLQPFSKIHLYSNYEYDWLTLPNLIDVVIILCILSLCILIIACVNFMNLATARSANRAREVGVRKVVGAYRSDIIKQFFGESILLASLSLSIALLLVKLMLPLFNNLTQSGLSLDISGNTGLLIGLPVITLITGILSGSYPALFLSSFQPVNVLKGTLRSGRRGSSFRKILIVFQFALTILLFVCTAAVYYQLNYMRNKDLGYDKEHILFAPIRGNMREKLESSKKELQQNPNILGVTANASLLTRGWRYSTSTWDWEGKNPHEEIEMRMEFVDDDYLMTFGMQLVQGRNFSKGKTTDAKETVLVNEKAVNVMRL
jgi:ABC-type antimicrobial peptide transport system permease subunit